MRTKEEALRFLQYKEPSQTQVPLYQLVTDAFVDLVSVIYDTMPDGPGKTVAIRKISEAQMSVKCAIANEGQ